MRTLTLFSILLTALWLVGCAGQSLESKIPGKYKLSIDTSGMANDQKKMFDMARGSIESARIEFKADKTVSFTGTGQNQAPGKWSLEGEKLTITPGDKSPSMTATVSSDGRTITPDPNGDLAKALPGVKITFVRE